MPLHAQDPPHPLLRSHALLKVTSVSRPQNDSPVLRAACLPAPVLPLAFLSCGSVV
ncbi:hypothetical protein FKM82_016353 [Ascaphus truei]